jgi:hypothetical protein
MKKLILASLLAAAFAASPLLVSAQPSAHYPPGVEGLKGSTLPPPGFYVRDYNWFYYANRLNDSRGHEIKAADPEVFAYANIPRVLWITDQKVLGGYLGVDALLPLKYTHLEVNPPPPAGRFDDSTFGIADLYVEGTLSWHVDQADFAVAYGVWAPTGDSSTAPVSTRAGAGFWTHMFTAGMTWYMDNEKKWALSGLSRYEINHEKRDMDFTPGQVYTLEWGLSYAVRPTVDVGIAGYYQVQTTKNHGSDSPSSSKDSVVGLGPEISAVCPKTGIIFSLRYLYEVLAEDRLQGHTVCLTLTKRL